jgi:hypothetical protein
VFLAKRSLRIPLIVIAAAAFVGVIFMTINIMSVSHDPTRWASVRSDLRTAMATAIALSGTWIAAALILEGQKRLAVEMDQLRSAFAARREADTDRIPRSHLSVIGTAAVAAQPDEMPGYAAGYADGLARKPMSEGNVRPISRRP